MMDEEERALPPGHRFVRHRWEEAFGAIRVALEAIRDIYPIDRTILDEEVNKEMLGALEWTTRAYESLDNISIHMVGEVMHGVITGAIPDHAALDRRGVDRYDDGDVPEEPTE